MLATRWEPFTEMHRLSQEMDRLFGRHERGESVGSVSTFPAVNLWEDHDHTYLEAELPGYKSDEIEVYVQGSELTLKAKRELPQYDSGKWHLRERAATEFTRTIDLGHEVKDNGLSAEYRHGVLKLTLAKSEAAKPRRIQVKSNS